MSRFEKNEPCPECGCPLEEDHGRLICLNQECDFECDAPGYNEFEELPTF